MPALKEIPINAYVAWCPSPFHETVLALGHRHIGAARLDFLSLDLTSLSPTEYSIPVTVSLGDGTLGCLSWSSPVGDRSLGLLATGFHDGTVNIWDPSEMGLSEDISTSGITKRFDEANAKGHLAVSQPQAQDALTCMEFNALRPTLIACGHASGGLHIINVEDATKPEVYEPGAEPMKAHGKSSVTCVAWNKTVQHIAASTCANGSTAIWNLKQRKASIIFRDPAGRSRPSSVAWLPNQATQVIVAYDDDTHPSFQMWDLRNTSYPFKEFQGHARGITDIQFSTLDSSLMLSCGKDNRMLTWSMNETGSTNAPVVFSESTFTDWQSCVRWSPCLPGLVAASSHIGGVIVDSVQERQNPASKHVPAWIHHPAGVSFGFGGKFVQCGTAFGTGVRLDVVPSADPDLIAQADQFELTLVNNDYVSYCEKKIQETEDDHERVVWRAVETLFYPPETRNSVLLECLGFKRQEILQAVERYLGRKPGGLVALAENAAAAEAYNSASGGGAYGPGSQLSPGVALEGDSGAPGGPSMGDHPDYLFQHAPVDAESFFNELGDSVDATPIGAGDARAGDNSAVSEMGGGPEDTERQRSKDMALSNRPTSTGGSAGDRQGSHLGALEDSPKRTVPSFSGAPDGLGDPKDESTLRRSSCTDWSAGPELLTKEAFLIGQRAVATEMCVEAKRWADALLLAATSGDAALWTATSELYLRQKRQDKFLQMIGCVIASKWDDLVRIADLGKWEETLALIASYVPQETFSSLCEQVGRRLEQEMFDIRAAVVCYLLAGSFRNASHLWSSLVVTSNRGKSLENGLQELVEKLTILKRATNYQHDDPVYNEKASQYAEILANSGRLVAGMKFLCLVGHEAEDPMSVSNSLRHRIYYSAPEAMRQAGISPPPGRPYTPVQIQPQQLLMASPTLAGANVQGGAVGGMGGGMCQSSLHLSGPTRPSGGPAVQQPPSAYGSMNAGGTTNGGPWSRNAVSATTYAGRPVPVPHGVIGSANSGSVGTPVAGGPPPSSVTAQPWAGPVAIAQPGTGGVGHPPSGPRLNPPPPGAGRTFSPNRSLSQYRGEQSVRPEIPQPGGYQGVPSAAAVHGAGGSCYPPPAVSQSPSGYPAPVPTPLPPPPVPNAHSALQQNAHQQQRAPYYANGNTPPQPLYPQNAAGGVPGRQFSGSQQQPVQNFGPPPSAGPGTFSAHNHDREGPGMNVMPQQQRYSPSLPVRQDGPGPIGASATGAGAPAGYADMPSFQPPQTSSVMTGVSTPALSNGGLSSSGVPVRSTAPAAGVTGIPPGMPVPWPIPTGTQQVGSTTQSTAPANQKIQATVNPVQHAGTPMAPGDLTMVQRILFDTLELQKQHDPHNPRKYEDLRPKLLELCTQLQQGSISKANQDLVLQFCRALQVGDIGTASQIQGQLTRIAWTKESRNWLMALKRLLTK